MRDEFSGELKETARGDVPVVTVVLGVHNGERFLREAIESVLQQTFADFEFVIIDDASEDGTAAVLERYDDSRIVVLRNQSNLGLTRSLNRGLERARGRYIARLDADDLMEPERLAKQVAYLESHPEVGVVGTWTTEIDENGAVLSTHEVYPHPDFLRWEMTHRNPIYHPTAMMRGEAVRSVEGYDPALRYAQDHDLWVRMLMAGWKVAVLPERLTQYRRGPDQISSRRSDEQIRLGWGVRQRYAEWLLGEPVTLEQIDGMMRLLGWGDLEAVNEDIDGSLRLIQRIRSACQRDCMHTNRKRINVQICGFLLDGAERSARNNPRLSAAITRCAMRTGVHGFFHSRAWKQAIRLGYRALLS